MLFDVELSIEILNLSSKNLHFFQRLSFNRFCHQRIDDWYFDGKFLLTLWLITSYRIKNESLLEILAIQDREQEEKQRQRFLLMFFFVFVSFYPMSIYIREVIGVGCRFEIRSTEGVLERILFFFSSILIRCLTLVLTIKVDC